MRFTPADETTVHPWLAGEMRYESQRLYSPEGSLGMASVRLQGTIVGIVTIQGKKGQHPRSSFHVEVYPNDLHPLETAIAKRHHSDHEGKGHSSRTTQQVV